MFIRPLKEAHAPEGHCGLLNKNLHGTRDANQKCELLVCDILVSHDLKQGAFSPRIHYRPRINGREDSLHEIGR